MNFYQFLKSIQDGIGCDCRVQVSLGSFMGVVHGLRIDISWKNGFNYTFVIPESLMGNEGFFEHFSQYTIEKASTEYRIAEVGED